MRETTLLSAMLIVMMLTSEPLALPIASMVQQGLVENDWLTQIWQTLGQALRLVSAYNVTEVGTTDSILNSTESRIQGPMIEEPEIIIRCSNDRGDSPLFTTLSAPVAPSNATSRIAIYMWYSDSSVLRGLQVADKTGSMVTYLHQDYLGSTRPKTDSSGNVVYSSNYKN